MKRPARNVTRHFVEGEFSGAEFGDKRLGARLVDVARRMSRQPDRSFPQAASSAGELEATYRFLNNARVTPEAVLAPHIRETIRRSQACKEVVVAHDTTEFNFGKSSRGDLARVGLGQSFGFYGHFALAVEADEARMPLGVVSLAVHQRHACKQRLKRKERLVDPTNEFRRWGQVVEDAAQVLESVDPVHVMDREADSYALMAELIDAKHRFVIRMRAATRRVATEDANIAEVLSRVEAIAERTVPISARGSSLLPSYRKAHPKRSARAARLHVSATTVTLNRTQTATICASPQKTLTLNLVRVVEPDPPMGEAPIEWRLWTTEPIETAEQVLRIVDFYRCRWRIEELFKALKSGCALEQRQLETHDALVNTLALMTPIAWSLLRLRSLASEQPHVEAATALSSRQLRCLDAALRERGRPGLTKTPTAREAMLGIAALGGHIPNNGDPGWMVLGRGFDDLLMIELGFILATGAANL